VTQYYKDRGFFIKLFLTTQHHKNGTRLSLKRATTPPMLVSTSQKNFSLTKTKFSNFFTFSALDIKKADLDSKVN
jgi:hypothetical protein